MAKADYRCCDICDGKAIYDADNPIPESILVAHRACADLVPKPTDAECACDLVAPGDHTSDDPRPDEWEQNPACPVHPDVRWLINQIDRLRDKLDVTESKLGRRRREIRGLRGQLDAVRNLHMPYDTPEDRWAKRRCSGCIGAYDPSTGQLLHSAWPCNTARAIGWQVDDDD